MCDYNFQESKSNSGKVTGHFTQLVWKPTKEFGIGYATGVDNHDPDMKCVYVVARYKPAGNILGKFSTSVGGHLSDDDNACRKGASQAKLETNDRISPKLFSEQRANMYKYNDGMNGLDEIAPLYEADSENIDGSLRLTANKLRETNGSMNEPAEEALSTSSELNLNGKNMEALSEMEQDSTTSKSSPGATSEQMPPDVIYVEKATTPAATTSSSQVTPSQPVSNTIAPVAVLPTTAAIPTAIPTALLPVKPVKEECK